MNITSARTARSTNTINPLGDLVRLAHEAGIKVGACVDVTAVPRTVYDHHPEWFVRDASGRPYVIATFPDGEVVRTGPVEADRGRIEVAHP